MKLKKNSKELKTYLKPNFSTIYVEDRVKEHYKTLSILEKFKDKELIYIKHYKDVFSKKAQNFALQKQSLKLILALKEDNFFYKGSKFSHSYGYENFYYNSQIYNCLYDCKYCYLQGMYSSAYPVIFVNIEDTFKALETKQENIFLPISYDTDLLAFEGICGFVRDWIDFARVKSNILFELRTKSGAFNYIKNLNPPKNFILAFSLSPYELVNKIELKTSSLAKRIKNINEAISYNFRLRICFDPIIKVGDYKKMYTKFLAELFAKVDSKYIEDFSLGAFRINKDFLKQMKKNSINEVSYYPYKVQNNEAKYEDEEEVLNFFRNKLRLYVDDYKIIF